jgi:beta-glucosidase
MKTLIQNHINLETDIPFDGVDHGIKLIDVYNAKDKDHKMQDFIKQFTIDDLAFLTVAGQGMDDSRGIPGNTAVIGGVTDRLKDTFGIPIVSNTDGPSGVRCDEQTLLLPDGTALASTWNTNLINDVYATVGKEAKRLGSSQVNGPGMNIHRNVRNGRNFEYYSEDPYLTGEMGKAAVTGIQSQGISAAVKHLAVNNREAYRY